MERIKASFVHFVLSALVVSTGLAVVYYIWYPQPFSEMNNIWSVVKILIAVDLVLGPLLTLVVFNSKKPRAELKRDLGMIACVQLCALGYGLFTMYTERPQYITFAIDRFEIVAGSETVGKLGSALKGAAPLAGPHWVYVEPPKSKAELSQLTSDWMDGKGEMHQRRERYRAIPERTDEILRAAIEPQEILGFMDNKAKVDEMNRLNAYAKQNPNSRFFPLAGRGSFMVVAMDIKSGEMGEFFALEPFKFGASKDTESSSVSSKTQDAPAPAPAAGSGVLLPSANTASEAGDSTATDLPD